MFSRFLRTAILALTAGLVAFAAPPAPLPPGGTNIFPDPIRAMLPDGGYQTDVIGFSIVPVDGPGFTEAIEAATKREPAQIYEYQLFAPVPAALEPGDTLLVEFYLRAPKTTAESGEGATQFTLEERGGAYTKSVVLDARAGPDWVLHRVPFRIAPRASGNFGPNPAVAGYAAGGAQISFRLGYRPQTIQLGGIRLVRYEPGRSLESLPRTAPDYAGRALDAPWRAAAAKRIDTLRKTPLRLRVLDASGNPVSGYKIHVRMLRHAFSFGSAVSGHVLMDDSPDAERYREFIVRNFNEVTIENHLKWDWWVNHAYARPGIVKQLRWLHENKVRVRGHCLIWPSYQMTPANLRAIAPDRPKFDATVADHFTDILGATAGLISEWDVVNEPYTNRDFMKLHGDDIVADWFRLARRLAPDQPLYLNDYAHFTNAGAPTIHKDFVERTVAQLKASGTPIDGVGLQSHFGQLLCPPERVLAELDRVAALGVAIKITEFDIDSPDMDAKRDYTRDFLTACFSHPAVAGVITWGFWEKAHWIPASALVRADWSLTPSGQAWHDLVRKEWWTDERLVANAAGGASTRAFLGDYEITVEAPGGRRLVHEFSLTKDSAPLTLRLPAK